MKNQEQFDLSIKVLVKAYQDGTLEHADACACAVGNLVAFHSNIKLVRTLDEVRPQNKLRISTSGWYNAVDKGLVITKFYNGDAKAQIDRTGYSPIEIAKIEYAFEYYNNWQDDEDDGGYLGLMSVVDCLMEIHEATTEEAQSAKELFVLN